QRGAADSRRRGLHHRLRRGALLARRAPDQDLRGYLRDPDAHHLRPTAGACEEMSYPISSLTGRDNYFEHFNVGDVYEHHRGRTITEMDNVMITLQVMNTAQGHFNEHRMESSPFKHRINFGGITASFIIGLASE